MKNEIEVTGKTVGEAIEKGLGELGIDRKDAEIKIFDEGKSGLFGLMGFTPARIKISVKEGTSGISAGGSERSSDRSLEITGSKDPVLPCCSDISKNAEEITKKMLELAGFVAKVSAEITSNGIVLNISSDDSAILIGRQGQTIEALEYILKLILSKQENRGVRITLDIDGYLERRNEKIVEKARELEEQVKMKGEQVEIKLPSNERKIIHLTLQNSEFVETVSEGEGEDRKLIIRPKI
ncbi:MAG: RNA-binding cell elongation regulator Jag/EloR [Elusimicrobiota bacterium]